MFGSKEKPRRLQVGLTGRKLFESMDGRKDEEKEENQEEGRKLSKIAEKIKVFEKKVKKKKKTPQKKKVEKKTTPMKKRRNQDGKEKMTPISLKKIGRKISSTSKARKVSAARAGESGKLMEGLRLSFEIGKNKKILVENLENLTGDRKPLIEGASPPLKYQVVHFNPENNQFAMQDQMKPLGSTEHVRKDVIGPRQKRGATPGQISQSCRP